MTIAESIIKYLMDQGLRQSQLAKEAKIPRQMLYNWIKNNQVPSPEKFKQLIKAMTKLKRHEKEELKKMQIMAWKESLAHAKRRDEGKAELYALDQIRRAYHPVYHVSVNMGKIYDPSLIPNAEKLNMSESTNMRYLGRLKRDKQLIENLHMKSDELLLSSSVWFVLAPLRRGLPVIQWSFKLQQSYTTLKWEKTPIITEVALSLGNKWMIVSDERDLKAPLSAIAGALKIPKKMVGHAVWTFAIRTVEERIAEVNAHAEEDDSFLIPRKLGMSVMATLELVTDIEAGLLSWSKSKQMAFLLQTKETLIDFAFTSVENDAKRELALLLIEHLKHSFPTP